MHHRAPPIKEWHKSLEADPPPPGGVVGVRQSADTLNTQHKCVLVFTARCVDISMRAVLRRDLPLSICPLVVRIRGGDGGGPSAKGAPQAQRRSQLRTCFGCLRPSLQHP